MYCFFFKQKTAYEMRISDWSSDVCSSDLYRDDAPEARLHHRLGGSAREAKIGFEVDADDVHPLLVLHPHDEVVARHAGIIDENVDPSERVDRRGDERIDREIGRASGRERVCPYV